MKTKIILVMEEKQQYYKEINKWQGAELQRK